MTDTPEVKPEQVWEDCDPRIVEVYSDGRVACRNLKTDRLSYIGLHRFKPGREGYKLIDLDQEEYIKSISPMEAAEIQELLRATLHGPLPHKTMMRVFATLGAHLVALDRISALEAEINTMKETSST